MGCQSEIETKTRADYALLSGYTLREEGRSASLSIEPEKQEALREEHA
jgi:hypothetical protein